MTLAFGTAAAVVLVSLGVFLHQQLGQELDRSLRDLLTQRAGDLGRQIGQGAQLNLESSRELQRTDEFVQIIGTDGNVRESTAGFENRPLLTAGQRSSARTGVVFIRRTRVPGGEGPVTLVATAAATGIVVVGTELEGRDAALMNLDRLLLAGVPVAILVASLCGYVVAGGALRPVERIRSRAEAIGTGDLAQRLPEPAARDELSRLVATLNGMLARLEAGFARERTFVADASHELRTPLARLKAELDLASRPGRSAEELAAAVASAASEVDHLTRLTNDLLSLARADNGRLTVLREQTLLSDLVDSAARRVGLVDGLDFDGQAGMVVRVDPDRMQQAIGNLLDNGLRHGHGRLTLVVRTEGHDLLLAVRDEGPGIPASLRPEVFERFTRADAARSAEGVGLGLAIVAVVAAAHGGCAWVGEAGEVWLRIPDAVGSQDRASLPSA